MRSMKAISGTEFEEYVWNDVWLQRFAPSQGWNTEFQKILADRCRVDFAAYRGNDRAIGDAKDKRELTSLLSELAERNRDGG